MKFTSVDRIMAKLGRDIDDPNLNEVDTIEWIGEALDAVKVPCAFEQAVSFLEVRNFESPVPNGFQMILQVAKYNRDWRRGGMGQLKFNIGQEVGVNDSLALNGQANSTPSPTPTPTIEENSCSCSATSVCDDCFTFRELQIKYSPMINDPNYRQNFTPIRLANHTFFNTLVCKEIDQSPYKPDSCSDEYTIVGTTEKKLRFSFQEGLVALSYIKTPLDKETGYPLIPDDYYYINAITYYVKWKMAERYAWKGREGFISAARDSERLWLSYSRMAKNDAMMPKTLDQLQNMLEQTHQLIPNHNLYHGFYGKMGREQGLRTLSRGGYFNGRHDY